LYEGTEIDSADILSEYISTLITCLFYSPILPICLPLIVIGGLSAYFVTKFNLIKVSKKPEMFSDLMV